MIWVGYAIGAFYIFGGLLALRAVRSGLFLDRAIAKISGEGIPLADRVQAAYGAIVAVLMLAGGGALLLLSRWAPLLFMVCVLVQAVYLVWAARALPPENALEAKGRQASVNAFVLYSAATAFVLWMQFQGLLQ